MEKIFQFFRKIFKRLDDKSKTAKDIHRWNKTTKLTGEFYDANKGKNTRW